MWDWLRSVVNAVLGKAPGKTSRLDTAIRMAMDADFSYRHEPRQSARPWKREREDEEYIKQIGSSADKALFEQLGRIVNQAQERDARDERRLYD